MKSLYNNRSKSLADTRKRGALLIMLAVLNREIVPLLCEKRDRRLIRLRLEQNQSNDLIKLRVNAATMEFDSKENFSFFFFRLYQTIYLEILNLFRSRGKASCIKNACNFPTLESTFLVTRFTSEIPP